MFNPDNWFWKNIARFSDLVVLSVCWILSSLPVFTIGAATTALYDAVVHCIRGDDAGTIFRYFRSFKDNFVPSLPATFIFFLTEWIIWCSYVVTITMAENGSYLATILVYGDLVFFCVPLAIWIIAMTTLSRFTFRGWRLVLPAMQITFLYLPAVALITVVVLVAILLSYLFIIPAAIMPAFAALIISLPLERIFYKLQTQDTNSSKN